MKKNIIFVNGNLAVGGIERALVNLLKAIDFDKLDVDLLLLQPGEDYLEEIPKQVNVIRRDITKAYGPIFGTLKRILKTGDMFSLAFRLCMSVDFRSLKPFGKLIGLKEQYDAAISFRPGICEEVVLNIITASKKITWWHHGNFEIGIPIDKLASNWMKFSKVVTVSDGIATQIKSLSNKIADKTIVIPNIIDIDHIRKKAEETKPYDITQNLKIVTVSRLSKEKNLSLIIDIALALFHKNIAFEWHIIGDGDMRTNLEVEIQQSEKLKERLFIHGQKENPYPWIKCADMMVHPSNVESFGIVLLEAMALGTPCISGVSLGAIDLIDGRNGLIADNDSNFFVGLIEKLSLNKTLNDAIKENAKNIVLNFTPSSVAEKFYKLIEE